jgi:hypothetical protein
VDSGFEGQEAACAAADPQTGGPGCLTPFAHRKAPNPEKTTQNPQFVPMEELIAIKPAGDN